MKIFLDTSAWTVLMDHHHPHHDRVKSEFERALQEGDKLFTHNIAVGQAMSEISQTAGRGLANKFYGIVDAAYTGAHLGILWIGRRSQKEAVWLMRKHSDINLDLYDFACLIMMRRRRIRTIMTTKPQYKQLQLNVIPEAPN